MQTALLFLVVLSSVLVAAGSVLAWFSVRRAPQGVEDHNGFHAVQLPMGTVEAFPTLLEREELKKAA